MFVFILFCVVISSNALPYLDYEGRIAAYRHNGRFTGTELRGPTEVFPIEVHQRVASRQLAKQANRRYEIINAPLEHIGTIISYDEKFGSGDLPFIFGAVQSDSHIVSSSDSNGISIVEA